MTLPRKLQVQRIPAEETRSLDVGGVTVAALRNAADLERCVGIQQEIWGKDFADVVPASVVQIAQKVGGIAAGAFTADGQLIGFVFGLTGVRNGRLAHWSHMLGVLPEHRSRGLGQRLKAFQRQEALALGVREMFWSWDPLVAGNAHFNLNVVGAEVESYEPEMYNHTGSHLHSFGTDRFIARWNLMEGDGTGADAPWHPSRPDDLERVRSIPLAHEPPDGDGAPQKDLLQDAPPRLRIDVPGNILEVHRHDPALAVAWRESTRAALVRCLGAGYRVEGFLRLPDRGTYVLVRSGPRRDRPDT